MDYKDIEQLLERYWRCETTAAEEEHLRDFFCSGQVPQHLMTYRELFVYQKEQREEQLGADFDERLLAIIGEEPVNSVKAHRLTIVSRLTPLFKAAAIVALMLALGSTLHHSLQSEQGQEMLATDTIVQRITTPSMALSKEKIQEPADSLQSQEHAKELYKD